VDGLISYHAVSCSKQATNWFVVKSCPSTKEVKGIKINLDFIFNHFPMHRKGLRLVLLITKEAQISHHSSHCRSLWLHFQCEQMIKNALLQCPNISAQQAQIRKVDEILGPINESVNSLLFISVLPFL
jgi:hypothetical protein